MCPTGLTGARAHIPRKCWVTGTCSGQLKALRRELKTPSEWRQWQRQWQSQVKWVKWVKWVKSLSPVIPFSKHSQQPAQPPWQNVQNVDLTEPFATSVRCLHLLTGFRASFHTCLRLDEVPYCSCRAGCACHVAVCSSRARFCRLWVDFGPLANAGLSSTLKTFAAPNCSKANTTRERNGSRMWGSCEILEPNLCKESLKFGPSKVMRHRRTVHIWPICLSLNSLCGYVWNAWNLCSLDTNSCRVRIKGSTDVLSSVMTNTFTSSTAQGGGGSFRIGNL